MSDTAYSERPPAPDLRADIACTWTGHIGDSGVPYTDRVLPDGCIDLIWTGGRVMVAGPDTGPVPIAPVPGTTFVGIRFRPGRAPAALGTPAWVLRDHQPDLADLWGTRTAGVMAERIGAAGATHAVEHVLTQVVRERLARAPQSDRVVDAVVATLSTGPAPRPGLIAALARRLGVTERSLHRRCSAALGYGPKTLDRVLRFRRALDLADSRAVPGLGALAVTAGYADQAHFTRECNRLAGQTPSELFKTAD